jgi:hypothetical protein
MQQCPELCLGLNTYRGDLVHQKVGEAVDLPYSKNPFGN